MESAIAKALVLTYSPVAIVWSEQLPEGAMQFAKGRWGCVMGAFAAAAEKGRVAAFDRETYGCFGAGVGLGFGNCYESFTGGIDGFCNFLSTGNENAPNGQAACAIAEKYMRGSQLEEFKLGERYRKSPAHVKTFIDALPMTQVPMRYVLFEPLSLAQPEEKVIGVVFLANPDQLSALTVLANYEAADNENVIMPFAAGCQSIGIYLYREAARPSPRAIAGLVDLSARKTTRRLGKDLLTFAVPLKLYEQMEANLPGSFIERETWKSLQS